MNNTILNGDALTQLKTLEDNSIDCCTTSPPYYGLRSYATEGKIWDGNVDCEHVFGEPMVTLKHKEGETNPGKEAWFKDGGKMNDKGSAFCNKCGAWKGELGLEPTPDLYVSHLCDIFDEVKRVLKPTGTMWLNLGDTYSSQRWSGKGEGQPMNGMKDGHRDINPERITGLQDKCLIQIPHRVSIELCNRGWCLRNTIIWAKPSCMPSSAKNRFTVDYEFLFFFVKDSSKYFFETAYEPLAASSIQRQKYGMKTKKNSVQLEAGMDLTASEMTDRFYGNGKRIKRCVWKVSSNKFRGAHFATYPEALIETPIKSGCPQHICNKCGEPRKIIYEKLNDVKQSDRVAYKETKKCGEVLDIVNTAPKPDQITQLKDTGELTDCGCNAGFHAGVVLDPFFGAGTSGLVAMKQGKNYVGIELNPEYIEIAKARLNE